MLRDLRHAARSLRRSPGFSLAAILTLAVGIGASTAVFAVLHAVLLRPLPYANPSQLVVLLHGGQFPVSPADYLAYRQDARTFSSLAAAQVSGQTLTGTGDPLRVDGLSITANLFETLGVPAAIGRTFVAGEDAPGRDHVVVLSDGLWRDRFHADPTIVGRAILLDAEPFVVVGVMPPTFRFAPFWATGARLWRPLSLASRMNDRMGRSLRVFGRLRPGVPLPAAQAEASGIAARLAAAFPDSNKGLGITVVPLHEKVTAGVRPTLLMLLGMVTLVLLVACVNVATLQLVRGTVRQRELAVRAALGAGRTHLVRQLLAESLLLGLAGGGLALACASWGLSAAGALLPAGLLPRQQDIGLDASVLGIALGVAIGSALIAGLVPTVQLSRTNLQDALRDGNRSATGHGSGRLVRRVLLGVQLALAMTLLAGAGLMGRTLLALQAVDPGFDPSHVLAVTVPIDGLPQASPDRRLAYFDAVHRALAAVPGVERVGAINHLPLAGDTWRFSFTIAGRPDVPPAERPGATWRVVRPGYFEAMRLAVRGRPFDDRDRGDAVPVVIVNRTMAATHWPGADPIGQRIRIGSDADAPWLTIVGVSADAKQGDWSGVVPEEVYVPYAQHAGEFGGTELTFVARTSGDPEALARPASRAVWSVDPGVPLSRVTTMDAVVAAALGRARVTALLLGAFAGVALLLAAVGIYAVTAYIVSRRTREIGIRMALGANPRTVVSLALAEAGWPVAAGIAAGVVASLILARAIATLLYEVAPGDPVTFVGATSALGLVALAAAWIPSRRASRIDPLIALREE